jgi:hypothetical protein
MSNLNGSDEEVLDEVQREILGGSTKVGKDIMSYPYLPPPRDKQDNAGLEEEDIDFFVVALVVAPLLHFVVVCFFVLPIPSQIWANSIETT